MSSHTALKAKRTDAAAPRSLFGTMTEIKDRGTHEEPISMEPTPEAVKPDKLARYRRSDADNVIRNVEDELQNQKYIARDAHEKLLEAEINALNFHPQSSTVRHGNTKRGPILNKTRAPLNETNDISCHHSKDSFSNEKYQVLGNTLGKGGKFTHPSTNYPIIASTTPVSPQSSSSNVPVQPAVQSATRPPSVPIPANLRHKYGEAVCRSVINDAHLLLEEGKTLPAAGSTNGLSRSKSGSPISRRTPNSSDRTGSSHFEAETLYDGLSNALRQDIFNGVSYSHLKSLNTSSYSADAAKKTTQTYPPKFAVLRNEDSKWNEDMVIYQKLMKEWDAVMAERSKPSE